MRILVFSAVHRYFIVVPPQQILSPSPSFLCSLNFLFIAFQAKNLALSLLFLSFTEILLSLSFSTVAFNDALFLTSVLLYLQTLSSPSLSFALHPFRLSIPFRPLKIQTPVKFIHKFRSSWPLRA